MSDERKDRPAPGVPVLLGKGAASQGVWGSISAALSSQPVIIMTMTAAFTIPAINAKFLHDQSLQAKEADAVLSRRAAAGQRYDAAQLRGLPGSEAAGPSALSLAQRANQGAMALSASGSPEVAVAEVEEGDGMPKVDEVEGAVQAAQADVEGAGRLKAAPVGKLTRKLAGGGGLSGGFGRGFDAKYTPKPRAAASAGRLSKSFRKGARRKTAARSRGGNLSGGARDRLSKMNKAMGAVQGVNPAAQASAHARQWTAAGTAGSLGGGAQSIDGAGASVGAGGPSDGGPINSPSMNSGGAQATNDGGIANVSGENKTPWQGLLDMVMILLPIAALLLAAAYLVGKKNPVIAKMLAYAALAVSAIVAVIGVMIMMQGQAMQGGLIAAVGGVLSFLSYTAAEGNQEALTAERMTEAKAQGFVQQDPNSPIWVKQGTNEVYNINTGVREVIPT